MEQGNWYINGNEHVKNYSSYKWKQILIPLRISLPENIGYLRTVSATKLRKVKQLSTIHLSHKNSKIECCCRSTETFSDCVLTQCKNAHRFHQMSASVLTGNEMRSFKTS